jgi:hypothetical protein
MRLLIDDDSTCSKDRACAQQPDKTVPANATRTDRVTVAETVQFLN